MKLTIKTLDQKNFHIEAYGLRTVGDLKRRLFETGNTNLLPERQQLIYAGRVLKDNNLLSHYSIDERKFLLVMARKPWKELNTRMAEHAKATIKNKSKRMPETRAQKPNTETNIVQKNVAEIINVKPQQRKKSKTVTILTAEKSLKNKPRIDVQAHQECINNRHQPTSSSPTETSDSQRSGRPQSRLMRNKKGKQLYKTKPVKSTISLLSTSRSMAKNRASKMRTNKKTTLKKSKQKECDEFLLRKIVAMGYNETDVRRALIASFNDPNEAVDYLIQHVQERIEQQTARKKPQQRQKRKNCSCSLIEPVKSDKSNAIAFLRNDPDFKNLRRLLRRRPNMLQIIIKRIGASHPELLFLLKEHEDDFLQLLHENSMDSEDEDCSYKAMHITPEEAKIIARLVRMGFKRRMAILAFIACGRNVEKAVDYMCRISDIHI
ncbi:UV excision repair protein RAD23 homolog A-like isoform X1 [Anastrepha obliqua]|uniref:UV excision repair protein RAD23 homolog A-like isoform X1 n=1 Tax=Anastrepha obliqua TaxID=95512 RepID=UPI00240937A1|nr:UV excision repair protein RAD23 homolog A-like isoform X1 [Anastrepha obliqua]